jgi:hypothetical protein
MRELFNFLKTDTGKIIALAIAVGVALLIYWRSSVGREKLAEKTTFITRPIIQETTRHDDNFSAVAPPALPPPVPASANRTNNAPQKVVTPIDIYNIVDDSISPESLPYGRLIRCRLINTIDSSKLTTPVVAMIMEDQWQDDRLILKAGTEIHGTAQKDRTRDRISAEGTWTIVWNTSDPDRNGEELNVKGLALAALKDPDKLSWDIEDGSAGIPGVVLKTDNLAELKLFAATFLSGAASGLQDTSQNAFGTYTETGGIKNAGLAGTSAVLNDYAHQIQQQIEQDGFYVRCAGGTEFYFYNLEPIVPSKATIGGSQARESSMTQNTP